MRAIMDAVNDAKVASIVMMTSAQVGKTELLLNIIGYHVHHDPAPILLVGATLELVEAFSKDRLAPMVRDTPALSGRIVDTKRRVGGNTLLHKTFPGGHITMAGANSPASLASRPIRIVLGDELDRWPHSVGAEGDPWNLAKKRATTFHNRKFVAVSTPTIKGASKIDAEFDASDQRRFYVPCPHCDAMQVLRWENVKWRNDEPATAAYVCRECGAEIIDAQKPAMLARGEWRAGAAFNGTAGFHLNELYSPWRKFSDVVADFLQAKKSPQTLQTWVNTSLGETWVERGEAPPWEAVLEHRADYESGSVPDGVLALVAGVDVQKNRLVYVVRGFGREMFSALVECGELYGDTSENEVWLRLSALLAERWGDDMAIRLMCVDSGYRADQVYAFARRFPQARATKGHDTLSAPFKASKIDVTVRGAVVKQGLQLWHVDASYFKDWIHGRLDWPITEPGAWLVPTDVPDEYAKQLVAESRIALPNGKRIWKRHAPDNHYLDAEVLATAGAYMLQIHRMQPPERAAAQLAAPARRVRSAGIN